MDLDRQANRRSEVAAPNYRERNLRDLYNNSIGWPPPVPMFREHKRIGTKKKTTKNLSAEELKCGDDGAARQMDPELGSGKRQTEIGRGSGASPHLSWCWRAASSDWSLGGVNRAAADADAELNWRCHHHRPPTTSLSLAQSPSLPPA
jgi:hypothetical protein